MRPNRQTSALVLILHLGKSEALPKNQQIGNVT